MRNNGMGAALTLLPLMAGVLATAGCASAYPELDRQIGQAVAAAQPTAADSAAARAGTAVAPTGTGAATTSGTTGAANPAGAPSTTATTATTATRPASGPPTGASGMPAGSVGSGNVTGSGSMATSSGMSGGSTSGAMSSMSSMPMSGGTMGSRVTSVANLPSPAAVVIDTVSGLMLVAGSEETATGSRGIIMRLDMNGTVRDARWIVGGVKSAILRAPRGMAIVGDTLWVADQTVVRAFSRRTGAPIASIPMGTSLGAVALSDIAVGGGGTLYVADAAVTYTARGVAQRKGTARIFRIAGRTPEVALEHARLVQPTAIAWDPIMARLLVASAASDTIMAWLPGQSSLQTVAVGPGPWDGIVAMGGTTFFALNGSRGEVQQFQNGMTRRVVEGTRGAGDMAIDPRGSRIVVPIPGEQRVEIWEVRR